MVSTLLPPFESAMTDRASRALQRPSCDEEKYVPPPQYTLWRTVSRRRIESRCRWTLIERRMTVTPRTLPATISNL